MKIIDCIQGSPEWYAVKCGKVSASHFAEAMAGGTGATRTKLMIKLIAERMTGLTEETYSNKTMDRGLEIEPLAREYYEELNDCPVRQVGFIERDKDIGASPDGLVGEDGMLEIKCPFPSTHIKYVLADKMPAEYVKQVQGQLWVAERKWCDFVSFDHRVIQRPYFCKRVYRDDEFIKELQIKIYVFLADMKAIMEKLTSYPF